MITDDVRRETAKRLREKKKEFFGERSWFPQDLILYQSMYLTAIDECLPDGECGFDVLADLIEPEPVTGGHLGWLPHVRRALPPQGRPVLVYRDVLPRSLVEVQAAS